MEDFGVNEDVDQEEVLVVEKENMFMHMEEEEMVTMLQTMKKGVSYHQEPVEEQEEEAAAILKTKEGMKNLKLNVTIVISLVISLGNVVLMKWRKKLILLMK